MDFKDRYLRVAATFGETCVHRWGWEVILHPDGTTEARSPTGLRSSGATRRRTGAPRR
ncbi:MAG TPA: hypothetical protein VH594_15175 [Trebonia sp.]|jgi:hypothetical protein